MESRVRILDKFQATAEFIIVHDADFFPHEGLFGTMKQRFVNEPNEEFICDFSDVFKSWKLYLPEKILYLNGPSTLVGTNHPDRKVDRVVLGMHENYKLHGEGNVAG
jgi:hypothetical protein